MNKKGWDAFYKTDHNGYVKAYKDFMYDKGNVFNCDYCPENRDAISRCGQPNCWVSVHCFPDRY
jgi:hypothetical protein